MWPGLRGFFSPTDGLGQRGQKIRISEAKETYFICIQGSKVSLRSYYANLMESTATSAGGKGTRALSAWNGFFTYTHESLDTHKSLEIRWHNQWFVKREVKIKGERGSRKKSWAHPRRVHYSLVYPFPWYHQCMLFTWAWTRHSLKAEKRVSSKQVNDVLHIPLKNINVQLRHKTI